jgi:hypothetical protein
MTIVALDVDLHKIYCVSDSGKVLAKEDKAPPWSKLASEEPDIVLMEISSPVMYIKDIKVVHNVVKWALWNMAIACQIDDYCKDGRGLGWKSTEFLVAPSHAWTHGHPLKIRHEVAKCKQPQKDLRECEAMIFYYKQDPSKWIPLAKYLEAL